MQRKVVQLHRLSAAMGGVLICFHTLVPPHHSLNVIVRCSRQEAALLLYGTACVADHCGDVHSQLHLISNFIDEAGCFSIVLYHLPCPTVHVMYL